MRPYRFAHFACHSSNIGDGAIVTGQYRLLNSLAKSSYRPYDLLQSSSWYGNDSYSRAFLDAVAESADFLLVGGGGLIHGAPRDERAGFAFNVAPSDVARLAKPVLCHAVGMNCFYGERPAYPERLRDFLGIIRDCADRGHWFSFRDDGSRERAEAALDMDLSWADVVTDPGMFVSAQPREPRLPNPRPRILVQVAGDRSDQRYRGGLDRFVLKLANALERLASRLDAELVWAPHLIWDTRVVCDVLERASPRLSRFNSDMLPVVRGAGRASEFFAEYEHADLVIGMRSHSLIVAAGLGVPFLAIESHPKVPGFMRSIGLGDLTIPADSADLDDWLPMRAVEILSQTVAFSSRLATIRFRAWHHGRETMRRALDRVVDT